MVPPVTSGSPAVVFLPVLIPMARRAGSRVRCSSLRDARLPSLTPGGLLPVPGIPNREPTKIGPRGPPKCPDPIWARHTGQQLLRQQAHLAPGAASLKRRCRALPFGTPEGTASGPGIALRDSKSLRGPVPSGRPSHPRICRFPNAIMVSPSAASAVAPGTGNVVDGSLRDAKGRLGSLPDLKLLARDGSAGNDIFAALLASRRYVIRRCATPK